MDLRVRLQSPTFDQQSVVSTMQAELRQSEITRDKEQQLFKLQLEPEISMRMAEAKWEQARDRAQLEKQKLDLLKDSQAAQMESQKVQIEKLRATYRLKKKQVDELTIRAGIRGRLQEMTLQVGQRMKAGDVLAKVAQPKKLLARLQIPETQAKDIVVGQRAQIDTRNGIIQAHVIRIDSSIVNGTRTVDCKLDSRLPKGGVLELSVDGTIELERLADVLYVGRPVFAQPNAPGALFRIDADGKGAERVPVRSGRASVNAIELQEGLKEGEKVILSDMAAQEQYSRIRLN